MTHPPEMMPRPGGAPRPAISRMHGAAGAILLDLGRRDPGRGEGRPAPPVRSRGPGYGYDYTATIGESYGRK